LGRSFEKKVIGWRHIVAEWWVGAWLSDIIDVESWDWSSKNNFSG
jgi:hypothetical protein